MDAFSTHLSHAKLIQDEKETSDWFSEHYKLIFANNCMTNTHLLVFTNCFSKRCTGKKNRFLYADFKIVWIICMKGIHSQVPIFTLDRSNTSQSTSQSLLDEQPIIISVNTRLTLYQHLGQQSADSRLIFTGTPSIVSQ